ncbi:MAG TPA: luciferase family protein [Chloroflexota bacterium]|nr:luciferase family protein [Chloroflexota bacterium]
MAQLPPRDGPRPETTHPTRADPHPHQQLTQIAPADLQEALFGRATQLSGVMVRDSCVSVPGARAFRLDPARAGGPEQAFQCDHEFAHLHPAYDGSLHLTLPPALYREVLESGWGEPHPISGTMLVFGPRNAQELEVVWTILRASYQYAAGDVSQ